MIRFLAFEKTKMPDLQKNYVKIAASSSGMGYLMAEKKTAAKKAEKKENNKNTWLKYTETEVKEVFEVCEGYKAYISDCKKGKSGRQALCDQYGKSGGTFYRGQQSA